MKNRLKTFSESLIENKRKNRVNEGKMRIRDIDMGELEMWQGMGPNSRVISYGEHSVYHDPDTKRNTMVFPEGEIAEFQGDMAQAQFALQRAVKKDLTPEQVEKEQKGI